MQEGKRISGWLTSWSKNICSNIPLNQKGRQTLHHVRQACFGCAVCKPSQWTSIESPSAPRPNNLALLRNISLLIPSIQKFEEGDYRVERCRVINLISPTKFLHRNLPEDLTDIRDGRVFQRRITT